MKNALIASIASIAVVTAFASASSRAQGFTFAARLEDGAVAADGLFTIELALLDLDDDVVWSETQEDVVVVGGFVALDVGAVTPLPTTLAAGMRLQLTVEDDVLPPMPLAQLLHVTHAVHAATAASATSATSLDGSTESQAATRAALGLAGGPPVAFGNITGLDPSVLDGDNGTVLESTSGDFAISSRRLDLEAVNGSRLAPASVSGNRFANTIGSAAVADGAVTNAKLQDHTLTLARFASDFTAREVRTMSLYLAVDGCTTRGTLSATTVCPRETCSHVSGTGRLTCDGEDCVPTTGFQLTCPNDYLGEMVLE